MSDKVVFQLGLDLFWARPFAILLRRPERVLETLAVFRPLGPVYRYSLTAQADNHIEEERAQKMMCAITNDIVLPDFG